MWLWHFLTQSYLNAADMIQQQQWGINDVLDELRKWDRRGLFAVGIKLKVLAEQFQICGLAWKIRSISVSKRNMILCSSSVMSDTSADPCRRPPWWEPVKGPLLLSILYCLLKTEGEEEGLSVGVLGKYFQLLRVAYLPSLKPCYFECRNFSEVSTLLRLIAHVEKEHKSDFDVGGNLTTPGEVWLLCCHPSFLF